MPAYQSYSLLVGRILLSVIFIVSGVGKLADPSGTIQDIASTALPLPTVAYAGAVVVEIVGSLNILAGFRTRFSAAVLTVYTLAAALMFHNHFADPDQMIHFMKNVAMAGGFLCLVASGPGTLSLDAFATERRVRRAPAR
ncbi:MAG TPA: DoxX family protein [Alphaproteobacteria bacterium]|jgi:putative oxidoreductase|nr:DoxX family protein [Alphaproteobacteria bacterium]